jgi:hypothetical protein
MSRMLRFSATGLLFFAAVPLAGAVIVLTMMAAPATGAARTAAHFSETALDMHAEKTCDHNDNNDYADDVENIHDLGPI